MDFMKAMQNEALDSQNFSVTENGALGFRTTGKNLLDLNFSVSSLRSATDEEITNRFLKAFYDDRELAVRWLFYARDVRGGLGERRLFRVVINSLSDIEPDLVERVLELIPEYGRWDDLIGLIEIPWLKSKVAEIILDQLVKDLVGRNHGEPISLLAKWLPSINTSSQKSRALALRLCKAMNIPQANYRKTLSKLRAYLKIVERDMSAQRWGDINYEAVPSRANLIYSKAFLRHDAERRTEYLAKLSRGEAKINSSVLYPHDIAHSYMRGRYRLRDLKYDETLEALWKALPDTVNGGGNTIVVADGSGSMGMYSVGDTDTSALEVANALAIYFAEHSSGVFKDKYITFSSRPQFVDFSSCKSLCDKLVKALAYSEVANTNIKAVFDLILATAVKNKVPQEEIPRNVLIISDMEFDSAYCRGSFDERLFETIGKKYAEAGYKLPRLVFWNVNSRTGAIPVRENENGVALVSGFSVNICKMVMSGKTDPYECLLEVLNGERYEAVGKCLKEVTE